MDDFNTLGPERKFIFKFLPICNTNGKVLEPGEVLKTKEKLSTKLIYKNKTQVTKMYFNGKDWAMMHVDFEMYTEKTLSQVEFSSKICKLLD